MNVGQIVEILEAIAPLRFAAEWDNVGLLVGSRSAAAGRALLTIDLTEPVLDEAIEQGCGFIIAYHPLIFRPLERLTDESEKARITLRCAAAGIAVYSPHTALDAAPGGVNDWLSDGLGVGDIKALEHYEHLPQSEQCKVVTFCPADQVDKVRNGLASIGAGCIGNYRLCSFELRGTGTFLGGEDTSPTVGQRGQMERVEEVRLEMVCPAQALPLAVMTLREFHPYEEPPIEIYDLHPRPLRRTGMGRRIRLDRAIPLKALLQRVKATLGVRQLMVAPGGSAQRKEQTIGLCAGAGGSMLDAALRQGCTAFITGEMRHHDVLRANAAGCTVILAGHTNTERGYLRVLRDTLRDRLPELECVISRRDRDPLRAM